MKICINAGHTVSGVGTGAVGYFSESEHTRILTHKVIEILKNKGIEIINCTIDSANSVTHSLSQITDKVNNNDCDLFVSIHFNAYDRKANGTEVYTYNATEHEEAITICKNLNKLGFKNRGIKDGSHLYVIKNTKAKALLIEVCFCDNLYDSEKYLHNIELVAEAIANGIMGKEYNFNKPSYLQEFEEAKKELVKLGITDGTNPKDNITREEAWSMLYRLYKKLK